MSNQEFRKYSKVANDLKRDVSTDVEKAKDLLIKVGVLTRGGNLKPEFKKLCTPGKPA